MPSSLFRANLGPEYEGEDYSSPQLDRLESKVRFSLRYCANCNRDYCISKLKNSREAKSVASRLGYFEDHTWKQVLNLPHENGISAEKKNSENHNILQSECMLFNTFGHLRVNNVEGKNTYRIFGAIFEDIFYILRIDRDGRMNH